MYRADTMGQGRGGMSGRPSFCPVSDQPPVAVPRQPYQIIGLEGEGTNPSAYYVAFHCFLLSIVVAESSVQGVCSI